jgi:hypothetical protein
MNPVLGLQKIRAVVIPLEVNGIVAALMERNGFGNRERVGYEDLGRFVLRIVECINQRFAIALLDFSDEKPGLYALIREIELQSLCVLDKNSPNDDLSSASQAIGYSWRSRSNQPAGRRSSNSPRMPRFLLPLPGPDLKSHLGSNCISHEAAT